MVIYLNHPSWWDPMICLLLARRFWPTRKHYAPIDAAQLKRYPLFERLGFFGVEPKGVRGGAVFLRTANELLKQHDTLLWITAQGHFTDARVRPIHLRPGLSHLLRRVKSVAVVPLSLEYAFWDESYPEVLAAFGPAMNESVTSAMTTTEWTARLEEQLTETSDALATAAITRDANLFELLHRGAAGTGVFYDAWRRMKSFFTRQQYQREHGPVVR